MEQGDPISFLLAFFSVKFHYLVRTVPDSYLSLFELVVYSVAHSAGQVFLQLHLPSRAALQLLHVGGGKCLHSLIDDVALVSSTRRMKPGGCVTAFIATWYLLYSYILRNNADRTCIHALVINTLIAGFAGAVAP